jgi:esterase/lipase superfamily enzyme
MANMFIVSCRRDFWSTTDFSSSLDIRDLDMTGDGSGASVTSATFLQSMANKRLMVLVHGYNTDRLDLLDSYGTIERQMRLLNFLGGAGAPYDAIVGFAWPGGSVGLSFPFARARAGDSAPHLARLLGDLRGANATVDLNTHSLGSHVAFEALRDVPANTVRTAWNFASAVDNESVEAGERYYTASQGCSSFYVFHSKNDPVLRLWYRIGDFPDFDTALGYSGPEDPRSIMDRSTNVRVVNCKDIVASHGGYRSQGEVWSFMAQELVTPTTAQFITLARTTESLRAVFRVTGGTESMRMVAAAGNGARRASKKIRATRTAREREKAPRRAAVAGAVAARAAKSTRASSTSRRGSRKRA